MFQDMDDMIAELRKLSNAKAIDDDFLVMGSNYRPITISNDNFHELDTSQMNNVATGVLFVDGGNSVLLESAGFCLGIVRIAAIRYSGNKRVSRNLKEFYVLVKEESSRYAVQTFPTTSFNGMMFDPDEQSLLNGIERSSCSRILPVIRRLAEIEHAYVCDDTGVSLILLDGTLESRFPYEDVYLKRLFALGKTCSLSKTCSLITSSGIPIVKALFDKSQSSGLKTWYYHPIVMNSNPRHQADLYFIRLNEHSRHVFRFEVQKDFAQEATLIFGLLVNNSNDPIFKGYPYGLVDVDSAARISLEESKLMKTRLMVALDIDWTLLSKNLDSMNAHEILDKIRF